jgi:predicted metal-dependent HD superfamily phosphohydrolase
VQNGKLMRITENYFKRPEEDFPQDLWEAWLRLVEPLFSDHPPTQVFTHLVQAYAAPGRAYHNLDHLRALFQDFHQYRHLLTRPLLVQLAIWFHDLVYDPTRTDNEKESAKQARLMLAEWPLTAEEVSFIETLILDTVRHTASLPKLDNQLFLDMDLRILGSEPDEYEQYASQIRAEYQQIPESLYQPGRIQVLRRLLSRPRLYGTEIFFQTYEAKARQNVAEEILFWEKKQGNKG